MKTTSQRVFVALMLVLGVAAVGNFWPDTVTEPKLSARDFSNQVIALGLAQELAYTMRHGTVYEQEELQERILRKYTADELDTFNAALKAALSTKPAGNHP